MSLVGIIKSLQKSGDKYTIVECGNGAAVANGLMSVPGAAQMLYKSIQPYSRESQEELIGPYKRSVSLEWVQKCLQVIQGPVLITQFQLQGRDAKYLTHGYIGCRGKHGTMIYHLSDYSKATTIENDEEEVEKRLEEFEVIERAAINIMYKHSVDFSHNISNLWIDGVFTEDGAPQYEQILDILGGSSSIDTMIPYFAPEWKRMEDFCRDTGGIILMRGSFNPIHKSHIELIEAAKAKYPNYKAAFLISLYNRDKAPLASAEAIERAKRINELGYPVIFCSLPYFNDSSRRINGRWTMLKIVYPVGMDTINRFIADEVKKEQDFWGKHWEQICGSTITSTITDVDSWVNHKFLVFERTGQELSPYAKHFSSIIEIDNSYKDADQLSSTKIRNGEQTTGFE